MKILADVSVSVPQNQESLPLYRAASLPEEYIPEIEEKLKPLNLKWADFKVTDNTCKPHPLPSNPIVAVCFLPVFQP